MKIHYTTGCTFNDLSIDGQNVNDISIDELKDICKKLIDNYNDSDDLQQIIIDYIYNSDRAELDEYDSYKCETCGDYVETFDLSL